MTFLTFSFLFLWYQENYHVAFQFDTETKRYDVLVILTTNHNNSKIASFFKTARYIMFKGRTKIHDAEDQILFVLGAQCLEDNVTVYIKILETNQGSSKIFQKKKSCISSMIGAFNVMVIVVGN